jgi:DNA repair protein SbcD/Mre11
MSQILHTADWHLGARLIEHDRSEEHARFLTWLLAQITERKPKLLIIAGDIFDSANPPQQALAQYYAFLAGVSRTQTEVLVLGGNHDSALTLNAPSELLRSLRIRVVGAAPLNHEEALMDFGDVVVCAVPYLRERDVRRASAGQTSSEVAAQMREGISQHYRQIFKHACELAQGRPVVATGHLTAVGVHNSESERSIQIGNMGAVTVDCFSGFSYIALGHLHRPQSVGGHDHIRYSGSPIALGFDEADAPKHVILVTTTSHEEIEMLPLPVPCSRRMLRLNCRLDEVAARLREVIPVQNELTPWLEITVEDGATHSDLDLRVRSALGGSNVAILKVLAPRSPDAEGGAGTAFKGRTLEELKPEEVFAERLRREGIDLASDEAKALAGTFAELLTRIQDDLTNTPKEVAR